MLPGLRWQLKKFIAANPLIYRSFTMLFRRYASHLYNNELTDIVIEGFPRSANTFAVVAFHHVQDSQLTIVHHTHVPANVIDGCRRDLPVILLIRNPRDSVVSAAMFSDSSPRAMLLEWLWFYKTCWPYRAKFVVAPFDTVINSYDKIIAQVNKKWSTNFQCFYPNQRNLQQVREDVDQIAKSVDQNEFQVARPSEARQKRKGQLVRKLAIEAELLKEADDLYNKYMQDLIK